MATDPELTGTWFELYQGYAQPLLNSDLPVGDERCTVQLWETPTYICSYSP